MLLWLDYVLLLESHITAYGTRSNWLSFHINHVLFFMWIYVLNQNLPELQWLGCCKHFGLLQHWVSVQMDVSHGETGVRETGWGAWLLVVLTEMSQIRPAVPVWRLLPSERRRLGPEKQGGREREWELTLSPITLIMHQRSFFLFPVPCISFSEWIFLFSL